jgi:hypothetical protein
MIFMNPLTYSSGWAQDKEKWTAGYSETLM